MQSGEIVPGDTHSAMNEATEKKTRTDWEFRLWSACRAYEEAKSRRITATQMVYPDTPGYVVRVDELTPYPFATAKAAALAVTGWTSAP
jgi:hypothetical protein